MIVAAHWRVVGVGWRVVNCQWRRRLVSNMNWRRRMVANLNWRLRCVAHIDWRLITNISRLVASYRLLISTMRRRMIWCWGTFVVTRIGEKSRKQQNTNDDF